MCAPEQLASFSGFEVLWPTSAGLCETDSALTLTGCFARANRLGHVTRIVPNRITKVTAEMKSTRWYACDAASLQKGV